MKLAARRAFPMENIVPTLHLLAITHFVPTQTTFAMEVRLLVVENFSNRFLNRIYLPI
jgi:hypothetical protein